jgi:HSP20 family protein
MRDLDPFTGLMDWPDFFTDTMTRLPRLYRWETEGNGGAAIHPAVDMYEDDGYIFVRMDLPGMTKDEIDISFDGHILSVTGRREEDKAKDGGCYWSRERFAGDFHRYVHIPGDVVSDKLKATYENGVLDVSLPKAEKVKRAKIAIESGKK